MRKYAVTSATAAPVLMSTAMQASCILARALPELWLSVCGPRVAMTLTSGNFAARSPSTVLSAAGRQLVGAAALSTKERLRAGHSGAGLAGAGLAGSAAGGVGLAWGAAGLADRSGAGELADASLRATGGGTTGGSAGAAKASTGGASEAPGAGAGGRATGAGVATGGTGATGAGEAADGATVAVDTAAVALTGAGAAGVAATGA